MFIKILSLSRAFLLPWITIYSQIACGTVHLKNIIPVFLNQVKRKSWGLNGPHEISLKQDKHPLRPEKVQSENEEQQSPCVTKSISRHYVWDHFVKF